MSILLQHKYISQSSFIEGHSPEASWLLHKIFTVCFYH